MPLGHVPSIAIDRSLRLPPPDGEAGRGVPVLASMALHVVSLLVGGLALVAAPPVPPVSIPVHWVTPDEFAAARPARVPETIAPDEAVPVPVPATPAETMRTATNFLAGAILADPANRDIRERLPTLERSERIVQLCNIEGLEQLRLAQEGTRPDALISYAFAEPTFTGTTLEAEGGAFRDAGRWYAVRFTCTVSADFESVTDFRFAIGDPIPEDQWAAHYLLAADGVE